MYIVRPLPIDGDMWGELAPLRGTEWERHIPVLDGMLLSKAQYGHVIPLLQALGTPPEARLIRFKGLACHQSRDCATVGRFCFPHAKVPLCYQAPCTTANTKDPAAGALLNELVTYLVMAWARGCYVAVFDTSTEFVI